MKQMSFLKIVTSLAHTAFRRQPTGFIWHVYPVDTTVNNFSRKRGGIPRGRSFQNDIDLNKAGNEQMCINSAQQALDLGNLGIMPRLQAVGRGRPHPRGIPCGTDHGENRGSAPGSDSGVRPRAHRGPELPGKCRRRQQGELGRDSEEEVLEAAVARARGVLTSSAARCDRRSAASRCVFLEASWEA